MERKSFMWSESIDEGDFEEFYSKSWVFWKGLNNILELIYEDYSTIRRALIRYGFLERSDDCRIYQVKE